MFDKLVTLSILSDDQADKYKQHVKNLEQYGNELGNEESDGSIEEEGQETTPNEASA